MLTEILRPVCSAARCRKRKPSIATWLYWLPKALVGTERGHNKLYRHLDNELKLCLAMCRFRNIAAVPGQCFARALGTLPTPDQAIMECAGLATAMA